MSREFSVRVSEELAGWVRRQGSPSRVVGGIASAAHRGQLNADVPDPGAGPERLTVRVPKQALPRIRQLTHSRDSLVGLRKLVLAGFEAKALAVRSSVASSRALPVARVATSENPTGNPQEIVMTDIYPEPVQEAWREPHLSSSEGVALLPLVGSYSLVSDLAPSPGLQLEKRSAGVLARWLDHPVTAYVLFLGLPVLVILLLYLLRKHVPVARVNALPAPVSLPKDSLWFPEAASRLAEIVW